MDSIWTVLAFAVGYCWATWEHRGWLLFNPERRALHEGDEDGD